MAAAQELGAPCVKVPAGKKRHYHRGHRVDPDDKNRGGRAAAMQRRYRLS